MSAALTEADLEAAALAWLTELGYGTAFGPNIAPGGSAAERDSYGEVVLEGRLRSALAKLNPGVPPAALDEAVRQVLRRDAPSLVAQNRSFHRMLVDGVSVEVRRADGSIGGELVRLVDFGDPARNEWLAVNQFTVIEGQHNRRPDIVLFLTAVKRILRKHGYPPDKQEKATQTVLEQAELLGLEWAA
jgi:type I restriction enzyme R subunit